MHHGKPAELVRLPVGYTLTGDTCDTCGGPCKVIRYHATKIKPALRMKAKPVDPFEGFDPNYGSSEKAIWMRKNVYHWTPPTDGGDVSK